MKLAAIVLALACGCSKSEAPKSQPVATHAEAGVPVDAAVAIADDRFDSSALGALTFQHSEGTPEARAHFQRGLLALHSFWYDEARREFERAIGADTTMNMAYWGVAMSHVQLLWGIDDLGPAKEILSQMPDPDKLSPREQAWVNALIDLLTAPDVRTSRKLFATAMAQIHKAFPDDESATFLSIALLSTTRPEDPDTIAVRKRAAALAQAVYAKNPNHPGAAHYFIHAYDIPELAAEALPHAKAYAKIAPAAFHARHMPSHIFSRLGMWPEAIASCESAWEASLSAAKRSKLSANHHDFHSLQWLVEMNFEIGHRKAADAALARWAEAIRGGLSHQHRLAYATEVASYMARTGDWSRVDELLAPLEAKAVEDPAPAAALKDPKRTGSASHCAPGAATAPEIAERVAVLEARAHAAAHRHDLAATKQLLKELDAQRAELRPFLQTAQAAQLPQLDALAARTKAMLLARAAKDDRALLALQQKAVADAHVEEGGEQNPSAFLAQEAIADTLLRLDRAADAARHYALALATHPKRASALLGAARANAKAKSPAARDYYRQLVELWSSADDTTPGLAEARAAVTAP